MVFVGVYLACFLTYAFQSYLDEDIVHLTTLFGNQIHLHFFSFDEIILLIGVSCLLSLLSARFIVYRYIRLNERKGFC